MSPGGDRQSLRLSTAHEELIAAAVAVSPNVVVSIVGGSAVMMPWAESVPAVLMSWYGGVEGGSALADIVAGVTEPRGRLPFAIPVDADHLPRFDRNATAATYDLFHGQWKLDRDEHAAHFTFGTGLGYTTFSIDDARAAAGGAVVDVTATNIGARAGSTVVFIHAGAVHSDVERPARRLIGFARVTAEPGASVSVTIDLDWALMDVRRNGAWFTEPGEYVLDVGRRAHDPQTQSIVVER